ncbi:efflux RND transporter periplasmic adaptor subunit [Ferrovum sp.]|uniref:efflux RND transporter periplasmic adaptor subunit n=1 Tax=Ferrovum sp. TaxID=2609467 RepID=UPI0026363907|nr:efflux RND transporter periplasmic adaptor subunit [Ferrovum sp.]
MARTVMKKDDRSKRTLIWIYGVMLLGISLHMVSLQAQETGGAEEPRGMMGYDGVIEAERQAVIAAEVSGRVVAVAVHPGDRVRKSQIMIRLDARAADQDVAAKLAQEQAIRAELEVATREYARQDQLFSKGYISQAALDRAEARFKSTKAQAEARLAESSAVRAQAGYYVLRAPFDGIVAEVPVNLGDMAQPGRALVSFYDPSHLRVTTQVPESALLSSSTPVQSRLELKSADMKTQWVIPTYVTVLPTADPASHTVQVRLGLPEDAVHPPGRPGTFVRVWLPGGDSTHEALWVPLGAVVHRAEMTGVYVQDQEGNALLRQVRLGRILDQQVEILSGVSLGEKVVPDAQRALTQGR